MAHFSTTSSTASSSDTEFSKVDEQKLRDHIQQLKNDRAAVKMTVMELESVHIDPMSSDSGINPDAQRLDLENAVLMQELMAMKVGVENTLILVMSFAGCYFMDGSLEIFGKMWCKLIKKKPELMKESR